jgi:hypothetical protein
MDFGGRIYICQHSILMSVNTAKQDTALGLGYTATQDCRVPQTMCAYQALTIIPITSMASFYPPSQSDYTVDTEGADKYAIWVKVY